MWFSKVLADIHRRCRHNFMNLLIAVPGKLYGRGATDDKGPVAGWMNALEAFQKTSQVCPPQRAVPESPDSLRVPPCWPCWPQDSARSSEVAGL